MIPLSSVNFDYKYTEADFEAAEAFLDSKDFHGTSNYGLFGSGRYPHIAKGGACHAGLGGSGVAGFDLIATESLYDSKNRVADHKPPRMGDGHYGYDRYDREPGEVDGFWNWFVYESEFGRFILNRDRPSVKRGWIMSTDMPPALTQALCIVGRHFYECLPITFQSFDKLVAEGVPPTVAYVVTFNTYLSYYAMKKTEKDLAVSLYGHRMFACPSEYSDLLNFVKGVGRQANLAASPYRERPSVNGCGNLFFGELTATSSSIPFTYKLVQTDTEVKEFVRELRGQSGSSGVSVVNPFKKFAAKDDPLQVTYKELFKIVIFLSKRGDFK